MRSRENDRVRGILRVDALEQRDVRHEDFQEDVHGERGERSRESSRLWSALGEAEVEAVGGDDGVEVRVDGCEGERDEGVVGFEEEGD